jgi:hypothetical protein
MYKVKGKVFLDGRELPGATVSFMPADEKGRQANGQTDEDGFFVLGTYSFSDGALPGEYKVVVNYSQAPSEEDLGLSDTPSQKEILEKMEKAAEKKKKGPKYTIPEKYSNPKTTPLNESVPVDGGEVELKLKSK